MKTVIILIFLVLSLSLQSQTHIYLSNDENIDTSIEYFTVYDAQAIIHKPADALTGIAWLSYSDFTQPVSYDDSLIIDVNNAGTWQFYSYEIEKFFVVELRATSIVTHVPDVRNMVFFQNTVYSVLGIDCLQSKPMTIYVRQMEKVIEF